MLIEKHCIHNGLQSFVNCQICQMLQITIVFSTSFHKKEEVGLIVPENGFVVRGSLATICCRNHVKNVCRNVCIHTNQFCK